MSSTKFDYKDFLEEPWITRRYAKRVVALGARYAKSRRSRGWKAEDIVFILGMIDDPKVVKRRGAQKAILGQLGLTTAHIRYWRVQFIHRVKPEIGGIVR